MKFCRDHGVAQLVRSPEELAGIVTEWRKRPELPAAIRRAMLRCLSPVSPERYCEDDRRSRCQSR